MHHILGLSMTCQPLLGGIGPGAPHPRGVGASHHGGALPRRQRCAAGAAQNSRKTLEKPSEN